MRARDLLVVACTLLLPCGVRAQALGPVETAVRYLQASKAKRCDEVWSLYSAGTQENLRAAARGRDAAPEKACPGMQAAIKRGSPRLVREQGDEAVVEVVFRGRASASRHDTGTITTWKQEVKLVREAEAWKVELQRLEVKP